jgi:cytochrome c553
MKRALKWVGYVVGFVVALLIVAVGVVYALSSSKFSKSYPTAVEAVAIPTDSASLVRGKHLVEAIGKCQACHGDNYAGTKFFDDPAFAQLTSANLTSGEGGLGGSYTDADYVRAIRHGVGKDGKSLFMMPAEAFYYFNDADLGAVVAYIKTLPGVASPFPRKRSIGPIGRTVMLMAPIPLISASFVPQNAPRPADVPEGVTKEYGEYLAKVGGCTSCHGAVLSGGNKIDGVVALNLTPGGDLGSWSEADFIKAIRTGARPDGRILSAAMPWPYAKKMTDDEFHALWIYIHSLPAKKLGEM